jgi:hypothetical protein
MNPPTAPPAADHEARPKAVFAGFPASLVSALSRAFAGRVRPARSREEQVFGAAAEWGV